MTAEREKDINEWLSTHCQKCANNDDRGTDFLNCQAECEVQKDIGIACIHYEEAHDIVSQKGEDKGVLKQLAEKQNSLSATNKAWSDVIEKNGYVN